VGSFNLVTNEFLPTGLITDVHSDLHVSEGVAGTMVTAPGVLAAFSALLLPVLLRRLNRRRALLGLSLVFVLADALAGIAPNFVIMLLARALLGIGIGGFWAIAVGLGTRLMPAEHAQRATAVIFGGISIGTVVGVPAGPLLGNLFGWRSAFLIVAALGFLPLIMQAVFLPSVPVEKLVTLRSLTVLLKSGPARLGLLMTFLTISAQFAAYTFVAPFLQQYTGAGAGLVSTLLLVFAAAGVVGNFATGFALGKSLRTTVPVVIALVGLSALVMPLLGKWSAGALLVLVVWGLAYGGIPVALQTWLFNADTRAANENGSGMFVAAFQTSIAFGSFFGGIVVNLSGIPTAMRVGAVLALAAVAVVTAMSIRRAKSDP
jgi:predicted MFS family arabinose efflux permease